jgi:hypothetical protein
MKTVSLTKYPKVHIKGEDQYVSDAVKVLANQIDKVSVGTALLGAINRTVYTVTVEATTPAEGNYCSGTWAGTAKMITALEHNDAAGFQREIAASLALAKQRGITLEHLGRQLANGLSPVTYQAMNNAVRNTSNIVIGRGRSGAQVQEDINARIIKCMGWLQECADGRLPLAKLPAGWKWDVPRLLRDHLAPGLGCNCTVGFDPYNELPCSLDPAMRKRPPAFGLAHELIHALHNMRGVSMDIQNANGESLEEVITTGLPPYNFEEFSDNKFRAHFSSTSLLRMKY